MTLDSHEIRLGNTYKIELGDGTYKSDLINLADLENLLDDDLDDFYQAMEISEEWLIRLGFIRHHSDYSNGIIYIKNVPDNTEFEWGVYPNELGSGIQIKNRILLHYVHQLENLYFALTGEELTYKI